MFSRSETPLWRDVRFWRVFTQVLFVAAIGLLVFFLFRNMLTNLARIGLKLGMDFLPLESGFFLGETMIPFDASHPYSRAFLVGLLNTLKVSLTGIVLATLVGLLAGIGRLSGNWLVRQVASVYIEVFRNIPLVLQILFWYLAVFMKMPRVQEALRLPGAMILSNRGMAIPWYEPGAGFPFFALVVVVAAAAALLVWRWRTGVLVETGQGTSPGLIASGLFVALVAVAWVAVGGAPVHLTLPAVEGTSFVGGTVLSPEFAGLLIGLVGYTGAYIAEVVRAGIQSVSRGQQEAARALGLKPGLVMRLVVLPQALRVIIPPLTSQYLNLTKNSSLAFAIGFPDFFYIGNETINQTGRAVEVFALMMAVYLGVSLVTSLVMNWYNRAVKLVER